jgi:hypothetical protein
MKKNTNQITAEQENWQDQQMQQRQRVSDGKPACG